MSDEVDAINRCPGVACSENEDCSSLGEYCVSGLCSENRKLLTQTIIIIMTCLISLFVGAGIGYLLTKYWNNKKRNLALINIDETDSKEADWGEAYRN